MTLASMAARRARLTLEDFRIARAVASELGVSDLMRSHLLDALAGNAVTFHTRGQRALWREIHNRGADTMIMLPIYCHVCGEGAEACDCATAGSHDGAGLYRHLCAVCESHCPDGEDCCEPDDEEPEYHDGYRRTSWRGIDRRSVRFYGERHAIAPYYLGIEFETDSTPSPDEWDALIDDHRIMGAWSDSTVRGPEIVTMPCRGHDLWEIVKGLSRLDVSLTSGESSRQCGLHMHIDCREASRRTRIAFVMLWSGIQEALWDWSDLRLRRGSDYCHRLTHADADAWIEYLRADERDRDSTPSRYHDLNLHSLEEHSTIEIRLWGWPTSANTWSPQTRFDFMWRCVRITQGLRIAARNLALYPGALNQHPCFNLGPNSLLTMLLSLTPEVK